MSEINNFKEDLYEGMMYGALTMNSKNCEKLLKEIDNLQNQLQQKENIIKEVREFIYKCNDGKQGINYSGCSKLLEILGGENNDK